MKKLLFLVWLFSTPFFAFPQFSIKGSVSDRQTGNKLSGAHIVVENSYSHAVSDVNGRFTIKNLKTGKQQIRISFLGYETVKKTIELYEDAEISIQLLPRAIMEEEVIISATRAGKKSPQTYQQVGKKQLSDQNLGKDLPVLLETTPGVVISSDAGAGIGYTGIRIRGTDITRINVTINGIPLNDPESQGVFWVNMPDFASSVDNIQVQRGVGTSTNGAAAFGASINIKTQSLEASPYGELYSSSGSFNTFKNAISFGTGLLNGRFTIDGRLSKITTDGYIDRASSDLKSLFVSAGYWSEKSIVKLNIISGKEKTCQAWDGVPLDSLQSNRTYNPAGEYLDNTGQIRYYNNQTDNYQQDHYQLLASHKLNRKINLNAALFYVRGFGYYENYKPGESFAAYNLNDVIIGYDTITETNLINRKYLDNDFYGLTFSGNYDNQKNISVSFGGSYNYYAGEHYGTIIWSEFAGNGSIDRQWYNNTGNKTQYNIFGKLNFQLLRPLNIYADLQVRGINYEISGTHDDLRNISQKHDFTFFNPKFGALWDFNPSHQIYFSFAVANREPTRSDFRDADIGHIPEAEKLTDYELGYNYNVGKMKFNANFFLMDYKNQLVLTGEINNVGAPIFTNVDKSYRVGLEILAGIRATQWLLWEGNASLSQSKIKSFKEYVDNWSLPYLQIDNDLGETDIAFSPGLIANSIFTFTPVENFNIKLISRYVGKQYIDNTSNNDRALHAFFVNDLNLNFTFKTKFSKSIGLYLNVSNILSAKYETNAWIYRYYYEGKEYNMNGFFPQAPIHFLAGISLKI